MFNVFGCTCVILVVLCMTACTAQDPKLKAEIQALLNATADNMVYVKGGSFMIGDTGDGKDIEYFTIYDEERKAKKVTLDGYHISKYEVTWGELTTYLKAIGEYDFQQEPDNNMQIVTASDDPFSYYYHKRSAIAPSWYVANDYCKWLGEKTDLPYALPSDAQWEYAARSRGQRVRYATHDGHTLIFDDYMRGFYFAWDYKIKEEIPGFGTDPLATPKGNVFAPVSEHTYHRVVGSYPPNPLGLYDMAGNAQEWVADWYQKDYYSVIPEMNPTGPKEPTYWLGSGSDRTDFKIVRGHLQLGALQGTSMGAVYSRWHDGVDYFKHGFRCALNVDSPEIPKTDKGV